MSNRPMVGQVISNCTMVGQCMSKCSMVGKSMSNYPIIGKCIPVQPLFGHGCVHMSNCLTLSLLLATVGQCLNKIIFF